MATSSITHNFVVSDPERFAEALAAAEQEAESRTPREQVAVRDVTDPAEIRSFWKKVDDKYGLSQI